MQKSVHAFSIPKQKRFDKRRIQTNSNNAEFLKLPSVFDSNPKKGISFGMGQRGFIITEGIPGPG